MLNSPQAEDLECLCHLMRTCGRLLDTDKAKPLMDQYFDRLQQAAVNDEMPSRIRFMLKVQSDQILYKFYQIWSQQLLNLVTLREG